MPVDNRMTVGGEISALACHITHLSECSQRYGANAKKRRVNGVIILVEKRQTKTGRSSTYIHGEYDFGNGTKTSVVFFISSVRAQWCVPSAPIPAAPGEAGLQPALRYKFQLLYSTSTHLSHLFCCILHRP